MRDAAAEGFLVRDQPIRDAKTEAGRVLDQGLDRASWLYGDRVARADFIGRAVGSPPIDLDVPMRDELTSLRSGATEAQPVDDVVEALLELAQQLFAGRLRPAAAGIEVAAELPGRDAVEPLDLLLFSQLGQIIRVAFAAPTLLPGPALLPRRKRAPGQGAFAGDLAGSLEPEFDARSPGSFFERSPRSHARPIPLPAGVLNLIC